MGDHLVSLTLNGQVPKGCKCLGISEQLGGGKKSYFKIWIMLQAHYVPSESEGIAWLISRSREIVEMSSEKETALFRATGGKSRSTPSLCLLTTDIGDWWQLLHANASPRHILHSKKTQPLALAGQMSPLVPLSSNWTIEFTDEDAETGGS